MYKSYKDIENGVFLSPTLQDAWGGVGTTLKRYNICNFSILLTHLHNEGNIVEIGVARGDCSKLIIENINEKYNLHIFDTFEGLPPATNNDLIDCNVEHDLCFSLDFVKNFIGNKKNVFYYKGLIENTYNNLPNDIILCHIDCDLYEGIYTSLKHVIPKLKIGGVIIIDDYKNDFFKGVKKACDKIEEEYNIKINHFNINCPEHYCQGIYVKNII